MRRKFGLILGFLLFFQIFSISIVYGQMEQDSSKMEHDPTKDFAELLKFDDKSKFFKNSLNKDFIENFEKKATLESSENNILIMPGTTVILEGSPTMEYSTILVEGNLRIKNTGDSALRVQKIIVAPTGSLAIGNNQNPIPDDKKVEIVFVKNKEGEVGIFVFGKLVIHGKKIEPTFVGLESYAKIGEKRLVVDEEVENWEIGDTVVVTSPGYDKCNEVAELVKVDSPYLSLKNPLNCFHRGPVTDSKDSIVSHVALLSRNVRISSEDMDNRGTVTFFHGSTGYVKYAEFDKLGPKGVLGRYPIHFHHLKDTSRGIEVIGNSITNSDNRWVTIHDSNGVLVKNNVGYISRGHGFFLEDGNEFDNVFENNIGIITYPELITHSGSSVFWTQNPMNVYRNNVAVNAPYWGFFFHIPNVEVDLPNSDKHFNLRSLPSLEFEGNVAYNSFRGGMAVHRGPVYQADIASSEIIISNFHAMGSHDDFEIKKHSNLGISIVSSDITISNSTIINSQYGIALRGDGNQVIDTKIKMEGTVNLNSEISGIVIEGKNNLIENSEIRGYVSMNNNQASDISVSNNEKLRRLLSAKIVNSRLLDPLPFYFGNPANENSFLEIYGYDAPLATTKKLPENFMLKKIGSDTIEKRGEYNNLEFDAIIKILPKIKPENLMVDDDKKSIDNYEDINSELLNNFKNKAREWGEKKLSDEKFIDEIEILFVSGLIEIRGVDQDSFKEIKFVIQPWVKKLVGFWHENSISDHEFINAIEYVLESNIPKNSYN